MSNIHRLSDTARDAKSGNVLAGLALGGLLAGLLASSCCILPLALVSIGIGGSWMSKLTSLAPYQPVFLAISAIVIGFGLRKAYQRPVTCEPGTLCASPIAGKFTKTLLWCGAALALSAFGVEFAAHLIM